MAIYFFEERFISMGKLITTLFLVSILTLVTLSITYAEDIEPKFRGRTYRYRDLFLINLAVSVGLFIIRSIMIPFNTNNTAGSFEMFFGYAGIILFLVLVVAVLAFIYRYVKTKQIYVGYLWLTVASLIAFLVFLCSATVIDANANKHANSAKPATTVQKKSQPKLQAKSQPQPKKQTYLKQISSTNGNGIVDNNGKISYVYQTDKNANISTDADAGQSSIDKISDTQYRITLTLKDQNSNYVDIMANKKGQNQGTDEVNFYTQDGYDKLINGKENSNNDNSSINNSDSNGDATSSDNDINNDSTDDGDNNVPMEYQNALEKGQNYASQMNLSKKGVYDQLTSSYGEGFAKDAANYAINHITDVDWKQNALQIAQKYQSYMHMSKASIQEQLSSSAGDKFTPNEAAYAAQNLNS